MRLTDTLWFVSHCGEPTGLVLHMPSMGERAALMFPPRPVRMDINDLVNGRAPFYPWDREDALLRLHYDHMRAAHPDSLYLD
ncbi:hypothetical protein [Streptomyces malaysiensis]|uniref:hypothetical protein n=1 Tax=Streptomyces malaysiensis TaxID=92644 RepID=UPI00367C971A